jgi:catechol 2,3-dioxygenase-like lactoylglutathione lyase family enzyme
MKPRAINPILNVSDFRQSVEWFKKLGGEEAWKWGAPPTFGAVCAGECEIFLCQGGQGGQGGRGRGPHSTTFGPDGDQTGDKGVWLSIWVDDVDEVYRHCLAEGLEVTWPPTDHPWRVREMHVRHPDGHVFRIGRSLEEDQKP